MAPVNISATRCNICFFEKGKSPMTLQLCSGCNLIRYCGTEHQKFDWIIHKDFCRAVQEVKKAFKVKHIFDVKGQILSKKDFQNHVFYIKLCIKASLKRDLHLHEEELITFPKLCAVCFSYLTKAKHDCQICQVVSYCCSEHQLEDAEKHHDHCINLKLCYNLGDVINLPQDVTFSRKIEFNDYMNDFFMLLSEACERKISIPKVPDCSSEYDLYSAASTFSYVATIIYALNLCSSIESLESSLTIYIVGAKDEAKWFNELHCQFLMSQIPAIEKANIFLIGPEVSESGKISYDFSINDRKQLIEISFHSKYFEKFSSFVDSSEEQSCPDIIACYNCGFSEYDGANNTWRAAIRRILRFQCTPIFFTSYTKTESELDLKEVETCAVENQILYKSIIRNKENPFKDLRPLRNWEVTDENDPVYFRNGYINILYRSRDYV